MSVHRRGIHSGWPGSRSAAASGASPRRGLPASLSQASTRKAWPRPAATRSPWRAAKEGAPCGEEPERGDTRVRVIGARAGVARRLASAPARLALQLRKFAVDRAQTPLTGHVWPPTHHEGAPPVGGPPLATGRLLQVSEPAMDGVRHGGSPSLLSGSHGGGPLPNLPGTRLPWSGSRGEPSGVFHAGGGAHRDRRPRRGTAPRRRCGLQRTPGPSAVAWACCRTAGRSITL